MTETRDSRGGRVDRINRATHDLLQYDISSQGPVCRQRERLLMPRCLASLSDNVVLPQGVRLAHLRRQGPVQDETVQPTSFPVDDLTHEYRAYRGMLAI